MHKADFNSIQHIINQIPKHKPMYLFMLSLQLLLLITVLGCSSSTSVVGIPSSTKQRVEVDEYESAAAMEQSRLLVDNTADNIFVIGQSWRKKCKKVDCSKACPVAADYKRERKCLKKKILMKNCCDGKCRNSKCKKPKRGCDYPTQIDSIEQSQERERLENAINIFNEAFGDTYSFQFTSRINATTDSYSVSVGDGNLILTDGEQQCYPVNENENDFRLCNILTVGELFDIISVGIENHSSKDDLYTFDQIVLKSVRYGQFGQPKSIALEPLSTISSCHPIIMRTRRFRFE